MVKVTVILPDSRKGQVEIDPSAPIEEVKKTIVQDLKLGKPENFILTIAAQSEDTAIGNMKLREGDLVFILDLKVARGAPVKLDPKNFK